MAMMLVVMMKPNTKLDIKIDAQHHNGCRRRRWEQTEEQ